MRDPETCVVDVTAEAAGYVRRELGRYPQIHGLREAIRIAFAEHVEIQAYLPVPFPRDLFEEYGDVIFQHSLPGASREHWERWRTAREEAHTSVKRWLLQEPDHVFLIQTDFTYNEPRFQSRELPKGQRNLQIELSPESVQPYELWVYADHTQCSDEEIASSITSGLMPYPPTVSVLTRTLDSLPWVNRRATIGASHVDRLVADASGVLISAFDLDSYLLVRRKPARV
ncbi:MAG: hypothetical protein MUC42_05980 [Bryobacter sp.]|nr:hypothetical protein [Bryobacter sp.]